MQTSSMGPSAAALRITRLAAIAICGMAISWGGPAALAATAPDRTTACFYTVLFSGSPIPVTLPVSGSGTGGWLFSQSEHHWMALGIRGQISNDWNLALYGLPSGNSICVNTFSQRAVSSAVTDGVEFVIGDYAASSLPDNEYPFLQHVSGTNDNAVLEWDQGPNEIVVNGPDVARSTDASDVLGVWDLTLQANVEYAFTIDRFGAADTRLFLFAPGAFNARAGRLFETTTGANYTPTSGGRYAVVVVNDNGGSGSYAVRVQACAAPIALTAGTPITTQGGLYSLATAPNQWHVVAVRNELDSNYDIYEYGSIGPPPGCLTDVQAGSANGIVLDFVVGETPSSSTRYVRAIHQSGGAPADLEWDVAQPISVSAHTKKSFSSTDMVDIYTVSLDAIPYRLILNANPDVGLAIFRNPGSGSFSVGLGQQLYAWSPSNPTFDAPANDDYAVVIYDTNASPSAYELTWSTNTVCGTSLGKGSIGFFADPTGLVSCINVPPDGAYHRAWIVVTLEGPSLQGIQRVRFGVCTPNKQGYWFDHSSITNGFLNFINDGGEIRYIGLDIDLGDAQNTCSTGQKVIAGYFDIKNYGSGGYTEMWIQYGSEGKDMLEGNPDVALCEPYTWMELTSHPGDILSRTMINSTTCSTCQPSVVSDASPAPRSGAWIRNSPDPFNPTTRIEYQMPMAGRSEVAIYDICGRLVRSLFEGPSDSGVHHIDWDGRSDRGAGVPSGLYFARLRGPAGVTTERMTLIK